MLETAKMTHNFRPNASTLAPLTCVNIAGRPGNRSLSAGCWDKNIYCWRLSVDGGTNSSTRLAGHTDFVKALISITLGEMELLVSASADATIIVWDLHSGTKLHTLKGHNRGVQALALESLIYQQEARPFATIFSGDSNREIRRWHIGATSAYEIPTTSPDDTEPSSAIIEPLLVHETSIYALQFDAEGDLWTCSADKTAKHLVKTRSWAVDTTLEHPDFVRAITVDDRRGWIVTACRDEAVRVWHASTGELYHTFHGHFEEVTGVLVQEATAVSVSIDGTIRQWSLKQPDLEKAREDARYGAEEEEEEGIIVEEKPKESMLTEDEERELAELMEES